MYAIVDVKDKQFKVRENDTLYVPYHSDVEVDATLTLDRVLLLSNGAGDTTVGTPTVDDASVTARVVDHVKGDKVIVFKKKRRKRYRVKKGHRQQYTQIHIESLNVNGAAPPPAEDETDEPAEDESLAAAETADAETAAETSEPEAPETEAEDAETADMADTETEDAETEASGEASGADGDEAAENDETTDEESDNEESDDEKDDDAK